MGGGGLSASCPDSWHSPEGYTCAAKSMDVREGAGEVVDQRGNGREPKSLVMIRFVFFFQAEDGIRDLTVTGVQTCALPISGQLREQADGLVTDLQAGNAVAAAARIAAMHQALEAARATPAAAMLVALGGQQKIGRASCRERG